MVDAVVVHVQPAMAGVEPDAETVNWHSSIEPDFDRVPAAEDEPLDLTIRIQPQFSAMPTVLQQHIASFLRNEDLSSLALQNKALHAIVNSAPKRKALIARGQLRQKNAALVRKRELQLHRYFTRLQRATSLLIGANLAMPLLGGAAAVVTPFTCGLALDGKFSLSVGLLPFTVFLAFFLLVIVVNLLASLCREKAPLSNYDLDRLAYAVHEPLTVPWLFRQLWSNVFAVRLHRLPDFVRFSLLLQMSDEYFVAMSWNRTPRPRAAVFASFASALGLTLSALAFFVVAVVDPTLSLASGAPLLAVLGLILAGFAHTALFAKVLPDREDAQTVAVVCWPSWLLFAIAAAVASVPADLLIETVLVAFVCTVVASVSSVLAAVVKFWRHEPTAVALGYLTLPMLLAGFLCARLGPFGDDVQAKWQARSWTAVLWPCAMMPVLIAGAIYKEGIEVFHAW